MAIFRQANAAGGASPTATTRAAVLKFAPLIVALLMSVACVEIVWSGISVKNINMLSNVDIKRFLICFKIVASLF